MVTAIFNPDLTIQLFPRPLLIPHSNNHAALNYLRLKIEAILAIMSRREKVRSLVHFNYNSGPIAFVLRRKVYVPDHR